MKLLKVDFSDHSFYRDGLNLDFTASQKNSAAEKRRLIEITDNCYSNPVIELAGLNASGKTVTLEILSFIMNMLEGWSLSSSPQWKLIAQMAEKEKLQIISYFYDDTFYRLDTTIVLKEDSASVDEETRLLIENEKLYKLKGRNKSKFYWKSRDNYELLYTRKDDAGFYFPDDVSIIRIKIQESEKRFNFSDYTSYTNRNFLNKIPSNLSIMKFLDPNLEYIKEERVDSGNLRSIHVKFKDKKEILLSSYAQLTNILSSGTVKGINLFWLAAQRLKKGGYLFVDELENHFNIEIVKAFIRLFLDPKVNTGKATLVFSTHYPELMDELERNDAIYILKNKNGIECDPVSKYLARNDGIKKSEAFIHDDFDGTAPSYEAFMALRNSLIGQERNAEF